MKTKAEHILYWIDQSKDDSEAVELLYDGRKYLQALFFTHLSLEIICKACWIQDHEENIPLRTHNLIFILSQTKIAVTPKQNEFLLALNRYQIEGRYPEQLNLLYKTTTATMAKAIIDEAKQLHQWLQSKVQ